MDAFAERINTLAETHSCEAREIGEYNRDKVEQMFTLERMVREYEDLFQQVLEKKRQG
ncbi:lipopolysaccharide 1,2-N-acetylglucosaminetransferase [Desulfonatronospira thiodismutans ASO3-1]|uniref:Lipopolysaccharide 1,2-N-acetylglucosaminetransferase n=1 Tax=Desulfonatronospira thiodismutans ASO3-1 TaxID=555779 RepID=D6SL55_9BACT|nr:glycosyltransferase family 1 protein [Desulfonatronospira thiodismutans]EFI35416.1 lipopolysaccharide 1,2-N-acetylglucosaminetransferase [Desulfonatronospira thiodismutans ASO3-1]